MAVPHKAEHPWAKSECEGRGTDPEALRIAARGGAAQGAKLVGCVEFSPRNADDFLKVANASGTQEKQLAATGRELLGDGGVACAAGIAG